MNTIDIFLLIPVAFGFVFGLFKGLIKEIASLAAIVLGIYLSRILAPWLSDILIKSMHFSVTTAKPVAFLVLFIAVALGLLLVAKSLEKVFDSVSLGALNKFMGGIFGALKFALIVSVLLNIFNAIDSRFNLVSAETKTNSLVYNPLLKMAPKLWDEAKSTNILHKKDSSSK